MNTTGKVITLSQNAANNSLFLWHSYIASTQALEILENVTLIKMLSTLLSQIPVSDR